MAKRIVGYTPIGDGSKDRGEKMCVFEFYNEYFEEIQTNAFGLKKDTLQTFHATDIICVDCFRGSELRNESASGALAGGLLFGLPGAIIGGIVGANQNSWYCKILLKDTVLLFRLYKNEWDRDFILKWAEKNNLNIGHTEEVAGVLGFDSGKELRDLEDSKRKELGDPLDETIDVDIAEINQRLAALGGVATTEFYRLKKYADRFTQTDILRLEAMERSDKYKE